MSLTTPLSKSEEDLLKLQEDYYKQVTEKSINPAAKLVGKPKPKLPENDPKQLETIPNVNIVPVDVLGNVTEKLDSTRYQNENSLINSKGFPQAMRRDLSLRKMDSSKSLFAQQMKNKIRLGSSQPVNESVSVSATSSNSTVVIQPPQIKLNQSVCKDLSMEVDEACSSSTVNVDMTEIHEENVRVLQQMPQTEILKRKQELLNHLDPKLIEFLKSKRAKTGNAVKTDLQVNVSLEENQGTSTVKNETELFNDIIEKSPDLSKILHDADANKWLHFDFIETEKLEWMKTVDIKSISIKPGSAYEARFDFKGWLQPFINSEINESNRSLYHHGDEPGRPGYTLKELLHISRSSVLQQRVLALNTIANLFQLYNTGIYDGILELPIEQIFFLVRYSLDDNDLPIINASIRCLSNMFYADVDEKCLDLLLGFGIGIVQPMLETDKKIVLDDDEKMETENDINDQQMAESDLIKCLLRTNVLTRIRYILENLEMLPETILSCTNLLIRIARDSIENFEELKSHENLIQLMGAIFSSKFMNDLSFFRSKISILKLFRIITCRDRMWICKALSNMSSEFNKACCYYLSNDALNSDSVVLQTEVMFFLTTLNLTKGNWQSINGELEPLAFKILKFHFDNTNVTENSSYILQAHASSIIILLMTFQLDQFVLPIKDLIFNFSKKVFNQSMMLSSTKCGSYQILSSLLIFWSKQKLNVNAALDLVSRFISSSGFSSITRYIKLGSNLLCNHKPHETNAAFDSVEASIWSNSEHVVPVLNSLGCLPLLTAISKYLLQSKDASSILSFLRHENVFKYFELLRKHDTFHMTSNWFTRLVETEFLINCLVLSWIVTEHLNDTERFLAYQITIKCIFLFTIEHKEKLNQLFVNVIFNKQYFPTEVLLQYLSISNENADVLNRLITELNTVKICYLRHLQLHENNKLPETLQMLKNKQDGVLPVDWMYLPILHIYTNNQNGIKVITKEFCEIVVRSLEWLIIFDNVFAELMDKIISRTEKYCRLACLFLCSDTVFLDDKINEYVNIILRKLCSLDNIQQFDFDGEIKGLNNFQDFYKQLLEQYQAVSYGNALFANVIIIPLVQKFNVKWRRILYLEYADVLETIMLQEDDLILPIDLFLSPIESDEELVNAYRHVLCLGNLNRCPVVKKIVEHHIRLFSKPTSSY